VSSADVTKQWGRYGLKTEQKYFKQYFFKIDELRKMRVSNPPALVKPVYHPRVSIRNRRYFLKKIQTNFDKRNAI
jgi:hypothetical protein